jgi:sugar lactone lactonase YvrE
MRPWFLLMISGCTLGVGISSPDANGLTATHDDGGPDLEPQIVHVSPDLALDFASGFTPDFASDLAVQLDLSAPDLATRPPRQSPIAVENQQPGDPGWHLTAPSNDVAGYADHQSYAPGDTVAIHAAASTAQNIRWELWRLGYYGGAGGRKISSGGPVAIAPATPATIDSTTGMVRAPWDVSFTLTAGAVTGFYLVKLIAPASQAYVPFVVRGDGKAPMVWPVPFNTYQAYNAWGGTGLYNNTRSDWSYWHAFAVSFDRPYLQGQGAGQLFVADRHFITFVEGQGYDLDYLADSDFDADGARTLIVLQGHSEYWTAGQRQHLADAINAGINVTVLGANDIYWRVRYDTTRRVMTGYKDFANLDPDQAEKTTQWRLVGLPENSLLGVQFGEWIWSSVPLRVDSSWIWDAPDGDIIPGLYGFEIDRRYGNGAEPAGVVEVGSGLGENHAAQLAVGQATLYTAASGATVFASGTVSWSEALAAQGWWDPRVQQATHNLFTRLGNISAGIKTLKLPDGQPAPDYIPGVQVSTVTTALTAPVALAAAPDGTILVADDGNIVRVTPAGAITQVASGFSGPRGLAVAGDGTIYVSDTGNFQIKKIAKGAVSVLAGSTQGFADGRPGRFQQPMSIALMPSGALWVVDAWSQRIRSVAADGTVSTLAGNGKEAVVDGPGATASFWFPFAMAAFPDGSAAVAESNDGLVRRISSTGSVSTVLGELGRTGWWDGPSDSAAVSELSGLAARSDGALVLLDAASYRIRIVENGEVRTLAGGATSDLVDGPGEDAGFSLPRAAVFAADGSLYVADTGNHALRKITGSTF